LYVGGMSLGVVNPEGRCDSDGLVRTSGSIPVVLSEDVGVAAQVSFGGSRSWTADSCPLNSTGVLGRLSANLTIDDLSSLDGVIITGGDYSMSVHVWLDPR
jgi:hypothetical protein